MAPTQAGQEAHREQDQALPPDAVPRDQQRMHGTATIPDNKVAAGSCGVHAHGPEQADHHARLHRYDRLQRVART